MSKKYICIKDYWLCKKGLILDTYRSDWMGYLFCDENGNDQIITLDSILDNPCCFKTKDI